MKVSRPPHQIKLTAAVARLGLVALCAGPIACAPVVAQAPFAYRSDTVEPGDLLGPFDGRVVASLGARTDFYQHGSLAKMERWQPGFSHVEHVRFVGGSGTLKRALGSELVEASLELLAGGPTKSARGPVMPPLDIGPLLSA